MIDAATLASSSNTTPVVTVPPDQTIEATGPTGAVVTYTASASDAEDGPLTPVCSTASGATFALGPTTVTCTATDSKGAHGSASFTVTVVDTTPPVVTKPASGTTAYATCATGALVAYVPPEAEDAVSDTTTVECTPPPLLSFPVGETTVTCTLTDAAGNRTSTNLSVRVVYQAPTDGTFFLPPLRPDGAATFKRGSAIPVKFKLTRASARLTTVRARLLIAPVENGTPGAYQAATGKGAARGGNLFGYDATDKQYIFTLETKALTAGTWSIKADLGDGVTHAVNFTLTR